MAITHPHKTDIPSIVLVGVPNKNALERVIKKLQLNNIAHIPFVEPDWDMGLSAVATAPISGDERDALKNYNIWRQNE
jgi:hypothetical protein